MNFELFEYMHACCLTCILVKGSRENKKSKSHRRVHCFHCFDNLPAYVLPACIFDLSN